MRQLYRVTYFLINGSRIPTTIPLIYHYITCQLNFTVMICKIWLTCYNNH